MNGTGTRQVIDRWIKGIVEHDLDLVAEVSRPDIVEDYPQSGERIQGRDNVRAVAESYPGGLPTGGATTKVVGSEDRWVATPMFTLLRVEGTGNVYTVLGRVKYPDGLTWHTAAVVELRDSAVAKVTWIFGAPFDPPEWRAKWVEAIPRTAGLAT